jgi:hypothetical protein
MNLIAKKGEDEWKEPPASRTEILAGKFLKSSPDPRLRIKDQVLTI